MSIVIFLLNSPTVGVSGNSFLLTSSYFCCRVFLGSGKTIILVLLGRVMTKSLMPHKSYSLAMTYCDSFALGSLTFVYVSFEGTKNFFRLSRIWYLASTNSS